MRAITQLSPGSVLTIANAPIPTVGPREILIKVQYSALNRMDLLQAKGTLVLPPGASDIIGVEVSGTVEAVGEACTLGHQIGQPVMALLTGGGYAEYCVTDERTVMKVLPGLDMITSSAIPEAFMTAYQLCFLVGQLQAGESVLLHAAASSIGQAAIQLCVKKGITVFATARSQDKVDRCLALGATAAFLVDSETVAFSAAVKAANNNKGVNVVLDPVGASYLAENIDSLAMDGRYVLYGLMGGAAVTDPTFLGKLMGKRISLLPSTLRGRSAEYKERLVHLLSTDTAGGLQAIATGDIRVDICSMYPLDQADAAHKEMSENRNIGKIVLRVVSEDEDEDPQLKKRVVDVEV